MSDLGEEEVENVAEHHQFPGAQFDTWQEAQAHIQGEWITQTRVSMESDPRLHAIIERIFLGFRALKYIGQDYIGISWKYGDDEEMQKRIEALRVLRFLYDAELNTNIITWTSQGTFRFGAPDGNGIHCFEMRESHTRFLTIVINY